MFFETTHEVPDPPQVVFAQAQQQGELATELAAIDYARLFQIQFTGLRSYLHRPQSAPLARQLIDSMFDSLKAF